jgi:hypothetical protein
VFVDAQLTRGQAALEAVDVDLGVVRDRVARRQVLGLGLLAAARTVELDDPDPLRVRGERVLALDLRRVDLARVTLLDEQPLLVVLPRVADVVAARVTRPPLGSPACGP